ncbi:MAG: DNA (cytosine-5-)-methyltransferase, partial [Candidatus Aenigmarchaeota archaeon]|nr:DNA (cytosine-5-)-methyltransferase [Candidatus Aenigmarchaeota archaeon]
MKEWFSVSEVADMLGVTKTTVRRWDKKGELKAKRNPINNYRMIHISGLRKFERLAYLFEEEHESDFKVEPLRKYRGIELFAGTGGLALGFENAGLEVLSLVEIDKNSVETLRRNKPEWEVIHDDIKNVSYKGVKADYVSGGFPCQAFSYAGNKLGFEDTRGTLFYEFARIIKEVQPPIFIGENVRGLLSHDKGRTIEAMVKILKEMGYKIQVKVLKAINYDVPQKRERTFIIGTKEGFSFKFPKQRQYLLTLRDALKDVPESEGQVYNEKKKKVIEQVP